MSVPNDADARLAAVAEVQAGVVSREQAIAAGLTDGVIRGRLDRGRWRRLLPGIYATFSGPVPRAALRWAVVLYAGPEAVLSHETAAELWGLTTAGGPVQVMVPRHRRLRQRRGIVVHYSTRVAAARHPTRLPPVTRVDETVLDLTQTAGSLDRAVGWLAGACGSRLTTARRLLHAVGQRGRMRWREEIVDALRDARSGCHSVLERVYLARVERPHGLPAGGRQARFGRRERSRFDDVRYDEFRLIVELDGRAAHGEDRRGADRCRDNDSVLAGYAVLRFGWGDVTERQCLVAGDVGVLLRRGGWDGVPRRCSPNCKIALAPGEIVA